MFGRGGAFAVIGVQDLKHRQDPVVLQVTGDVETLFLMIDDVVGLE